MKSNGKNNERRPAAQPGRNNNNTSHAKKPMKKTPSARELAAKAEYEAKVREYRKKMLAYYARFGVTAILLAILLAGILFGIVSCNFFSSLGKGGSENFSYTVELLKSAADEDNEKTVLHNDTVFIDGAV